MIWVCRPGKQGKYYDLFVKTRRIYLTWDGYRQDLSELKTASEFKDLVIAEKNPGARTTISNWSTELYSFCVAMEVNDYVLIPSQFSRTYLLCRVIGEYEYDAQAILPHSRKIEIISKEVPKTQFSQTTQYSLGAYLTVFKAKHGDEILRVMKPEI